MGIKPNEEEVIGVGNFGDIEILIKGDSKIVIGAGHKCYSKNEELMIICPSIKIKIFLNSVIPKQASLLVDYYQSKVKTDLRKSTFRTCNLQMWTAETVMEFSEWVRRDGDSSSTTENHS